MDTVQTKNCLPVKGDVFKYIAGCSTQFDFIFADPPYQLENISEIPDLIFDGNLLAPDGIFVLEHGSKNNFTLLNVLEDKDAAKADALVEESTLSDDLLQFLAILNEREQRVINLYFGNGYERQTMAEIAEAMGLKRERVRQVRDQALRKLRRAAKRKIKED